MAKPVVGTAIDSVPEIVVDGKSGVLVAPGDIDTLADALVRFASDAPLRTALGRAGEHGHERSSHLTGWSTGTEAVYREVITEGHP